MLWRKIKNRDLRQDQEMVNVLHLHSALLAMQGIAPPPVGAIQGQVSCPRTQRPTKTEWDLNCQPFGLWATRSSY